jgi:hypothetical protein
MITVMAVVWTLAMAFPVYWAIASNASLILAYAVSFLCKPFPPLRLRVSAVIKKSSGTQIPSTNDVTDTAITPVKSINILLVNAAAEVINKATSNLCVSAVK